MADNKKQLVRKQVIKEQSKWFNLYSLLPVIVALFTLIVFFAWGIIDATAFTTRKTHGVLKLNTGFGCWVLWAGIGLVIAIAEYFVLKIATSYNILSVCYLEKLCDMGDDEEEKIALEQKVDTEDVVICPECGFMVFKNETKCSNCGKEIIR